MFDDSFLWAWCWFHQSSLICVITFVANCVQSIVKMRSRSSPRHLWKMYDMTLTVFLCNVLRLGCMNIWILVVIHHLIEVIVVRDSYSSVRSIGVGQNMIVVTVNYVIIVLFCAGFTLHIYVGHFKLYHKLQSVQFPDVTCVAAILSCTMLQSQWLLRLLAFWKFVLMLSIFIMKWTINACDCQLMQHLLCTALTVFARKAFTVLGQIMMMVILTQQVWIIIIVWIVFMLPLRNCLLDLYYFDLSCPCPKNSLMIIGSFCQKTS